MRESKWHWLVLVMIILSAAVLRLWQLGKLPHGFTWDEAAIGYNGHAVLTTRRDEWLKRFPISFRSFGDYKAPLAIYLNGFFTLAFGNNPLAVRLPFALNGILAVGLMYWLIRELLADQNKLTNQHANTIALLAAAFLAISSWHIHFSRVGFESGLALTLCLMTLIGIIRGLRTEQFWWVLFGISSAVASLYAYHSSKIATPLLVLLALWYVGWRKALRPKYLVAVLWGVLIALPLLYDLVWGHGLTRASTLLFSRGYSVIEFFTIFISNWSKQLSIDFLFLGWTDTLRHGTQKYGVLYALDTVPLLWLVVRAATQHLKPKELAIPTSRPLLFLSVSVILCLLPAALGDLVPHPNRALLAIMGFVGLIAFGWYDLLTFFGQQKLSILIGIAYVIQLGLFFNYYQTTYAKTSATAFYDGYLEAATIANQIEKSGWQGIIPEKILFTSDYGQPYIYVLFVKNTSPIFYQGGALVKYEFTGDIDVGDLQRAKTLIVASATDDIPLDWANHVIRGSDGEVAFKLYYPKEQP